MKIKLKLKNKIVKNIYIIYKKNFNYKKGEKIYNKNNIYIIRIDVVAN